MLNIQWNGDNNFGSKVSSGAYIYTIVAGEFFQAKKMILMK
jgi:flagellar hook assembly protein FlgD